MEPPNLTDQLRFYFERQDVIDQWAEMPKQAQLFADGFFLSLAPIVEERARPFGVSSTTWLKSSNQLIGLYRPAWLGPDGEPRVAVVIAWKRSTASFVGDGTPWIGVRIRRSDVHEATSLHLLPAVLLEDERLDALGDADETDALWPRWRDAPNTFEPFWEHLDAYGGQLVDGLLEAWDAAAPVLDDAMQTAPPLG